MNSIVETLKRHWPEYLMEMSGLGIFMISACTFGALLEHPGSLVHQSLGSATGRRVLMGLLMGLTAVAIIYSPWGRQSGAHINPAVTLTFWRLGKVSSVDAACYGAAHFAGASAGVLIAALAAGPLLAHPSVNYVATVPGPRGPGVAFAAEFVISFILMTVVLNVSHTDRLARYTGLCAGALAATWIIVEGPLSGMSMNPARTFGSAFAGRIWGSLWIYFTAPPLAMLAASELYLRLRGGRSTACAKLHHENSKRCIFCGARGGRMIRPATVKGEGEMIGQTRMILGLGAMLLLGAMLAGRPAAAKSEKKETRFTVRIENISARDGQTAANGTKYSFALSPGLWVVHEREVRLFREGNPAAPGIEMQAEDGNPAGIVKYLDGHHSGMQHGVFNTPSGATAPGPIGPGGVYEFSFNAAPGMKLSLAMMFGQSNDWFYAPEPSGIPLFQNGRPLAGGVTGRLILWDAGTEVNQEIGIGPDQGPRQAAPNAGAAENGVVRKAKGSPFLTRTAELFRVTVSPEPMA